MSWQTCPVGHEPAVPSQRVRQTGEAPTHASPGPQAESVLFTTPQDSPTPAISSGQAHAPLEVQA
jgi:hypothetical protein